MTSDRQKKDLRDQYRRLLAEFRQSHELAEFEAAMRQNLQSYLAFRFHSQPLSSLRVMAYRPLKSEIAILDLLSGLGLQVYLPEVRGQRLCASGPAGCLPLHKMDLVITPGLFIDPKGFRLGRGGGYYDRELRFIPRQKTLFVGYSWQMLPGLPLGHYDRRVGAFLSEEKIRYLL